ncbi:unnamed protein product [Vitrella brassicaformis CCMP3155]|uniref:Uncharacterized protein n=1 Tax=Vitrella brassicaformis (strain CCMP3155) TaxID=1169540 RepID=A0A0G4FZV0_VITBC|nr:unnamed protein product [Vitrella brassicaformis CCMP3155]|eukprot:CEM20921.1 unnamed protein product [Vitrella brassicaformis CCMP3155]
MIWSGKAPNGFVAGGVPVPGPRPIGGHRAIMTVHADEGEPSSSGSTGEGSGVASDQMDVPEDHCEANVCISAGVKDKMVTRPKRKTGKDMPSGVVVDVLHERRGKRKRTPKLLPEDGGPHQGPAARPWPTPTARPSRRTAKKKATTAPIQEEKPPMSSQPLPTSPTPPAPDHLLTPTHQLDPETLLKMAKEEADRLAMPPPPLPDFLLKKAPAPKKVASKPKPKAKGKRAKVTKAEREAAAKEKEEASMRQWNYERFMREHGWKRQVNPFYLPGQGSPWLRERGENGNENSSESDDENEDWERWAATDAFKAEAPKRGGELLLSGLDVAMAKRGHKDGTPDPASDRIEEECPAEEEERPSKVARVMETDLSRLGEGEGDATMADTLLWMERMEEWWAGVSMPSPTWPPIECEMMADGLLQDSDLFAFE